MFTQLCSTYLRYSKNSKVISLLKTSIEETQWSDLKFSFGESPIPPHATQDYIIKQLHQTTSENAWSSLSSGLELNLQTAKYIHALQNSEETFSAPGSKWPLFLTWSVVITRMRWMKLTKLQQPLSLYLNSGISITYPKVCNKCTQYCSKIVREN